MTMGPWRCGFRINNSDTCRRVVPDHGVRCVEHEGLVEYQPDAAEIAVALSAVESAFANFERWLATPRNESNEQLPCSTCGEQRLVGDLENVAMTSLCEPIWVCGECHRRRYERWQAAGEGDYDAVWREQLDKFRAAWPTLPDSQPSPHDPHRP